MTNTPLRAWCYLEGESEASWWITVNHGRTWERDRGDRLRVTTEQLVHEAHGHNDPEATKLFSKTQLARFQPHRAGT